MDCHKTLTARGLNEPLVTYYESLQIWIYSFVLLVKVLVRERQLLQELLLLYSFKFSVFGLLVRGDAVSPIIHLSLNNSYDYLQQQEEEELLQKFIDKVIYLCQVKITLGAF